MTLTADDVEDMWAAYNLIEKGDIVRGGAYRKIQKGTGGGGGDSGSGSTERVRTTLSLQVTEVSFDPESGAVRVAGRNVEENEFVKMGAHHTLDLEAHRSFDLEKSHWDSMHWRRLEEAASISSKAEIAAVVMDMGLANVCLVTETMTVVRGKVEMSVPKKRLGAGQYEKAAQRFYEAVLAALLKAVNFETVKAVILASPGFVKDDFYRYMMEEASSKDMRAILDHKSCFVLAHAASGHKRSLNSIWSDEKVMSQLSSTKAAGEIAALQGFFKTLNTDSDRAYYGYRHVKAACDRGAVATLLVSDALFRARDSALRKAYVTLVEEVGASGGAVHVFSSLHVSGEQLTQIGGVAALLRFPIADIEEAAAAIPALRSAAAVAVAAGAGAAAAGAGAGGAGLSRMPSAAPQLKQGSGSGSGGGGGGAAAGGAAGGDFAAGSGHEFDWDASSDASSDSDASYKKGK